MQLRCAAARLSSAEALESVTSLQVAMSVALNFDAGAPIPRVSAQRLPCLRLALRCSRKAAGGERGTRWQ